MYIEIVPLVLFLASYGCLLAAMDPKSKYGFLAVAAGLCAILVVLWPYIDRAQLARR